MDPVSSPPLRADSVNETRPVGSQDPNQPGNGGSNPTSALQFLIHPVSYAIAKPFIERWHYSRCIPKGKNICYGLYAAAELYAVIVYGIGVNPYQARFLKVDRVLEIKRMCRSEPPLPGFPLSRLIALTTRFICRDHPPAPQCIVAFADPEHGHEGTVYKATGFTRHGETNPEWHVVGTDGVKRHRRYAYRYSRRKGCSIAEARMALGLTRVQTLPKIRWVKYLDTPPPSPLG